MITRLRQLLRPCYGDRIEVRPRRWWNQADRQSAMLAAKVLEKDLLERRWIAPERRVRLPPGTVALPPADRERVERAVEALGPLTHQNADKWPSIEREHAVEIVLAVLARMRGESNDSGRSDTH